MQMETNHQLWFQVSIRTRFLSLYHLYPRPVHGKLTEWNTNQDPFPLASSVHFSHSVVSDSMQPQEPQHTRSLCPSPTPGIYSDSCPLSQ
uniref:Uncharacterized protein n=1 Tax=Bos indicus x Bos taurus TaxID=30522 RepID=A0A4W2FVV1_BOBOX